MVIVNRKYAPLMSIVNIYQICSSNDDRECDTRQNETRGHLLSPGTDSDSMSNRGDNEQAPERAQTKAGGVCKSSST